MLTPWVGMLAEDIIAGKAIGELVHEILAQQFTKLRDGDRFYYENDAEFTAQEKQDLRETLLSDIIKRNTTITNIQDDVFHAQPHILTSVEMTPFENIRGIDIHAYPNPVHQHLILNIEARQEEQLSFYLSDINGRIFLQDELVIEAGDNQFTFELDDQYTQGVYVINLANQSGSGNLRLVKQ